jgi:hypothetical protein
MTTLIVYDHAFKNPRYRRLQKHVDLAPDIARELVAVYIALGYPCECIEVMETTEVRDAA